MGKNFAVLDIFFMGINFVQIVEGGVSINIS
jgi:hypothetical protein